MAGYLSNFQIDDAVVRWWVFSLFNVKVLHGPVQSLRNQYAATDTTVNDDSWGTKSGRCLEDVKRRLAIHVRLILLRLGSCLF